MRNLSSAWKEKVRNGMDVNYLKYADITLKDGTVLNLTNKDFWENGMEFEDSVSSDESFDIGSAIINKLTLTINNFDGQYSEYDFEDASVICYIGLETESKKIEKKRICTMTVVEQPEDETVTIGLVCEDNMRKFDKDYSLSKLKYPATRAQIVRDACSVCGVTLQTQIFDRSDYIVQVRPSDEALTFRQVLQWVAQIGCQWMRCDEYGRLCIGWYKSINEGTLVLDENGVLTSPDRDIIVANETASVENGSFIECNGVLKLFLVDKDGNISQMPPTYSFTPQHTDVVITGVRVTEYSDSLDDDAASYISGKEGYVLDISENKLIGKGDGETVAAMIAEKCVGMLFRPFEAECVTDVSLEAGDSVVIVDRNGKTYTSFVTSTVLSPGNGQSIACNAKSAAKNSSVQYSQETQAFVAARNMIKKEKSERERALEEFKERMDKATGLYSTIEVQEDGSKIYYLHDKPTLAESKAVWKMTAEAWGVSTDGGQTWNGGMTVDGDTIVRILNAVGINADWINAGSILVKDKSGNIIFKADMDTGSVTLDGSCVTIGGKPLDEKFENVENAVASAKNMTMQLTNEYQSIVTDADGNITGTFPTVTTTAQVMYGTNDVTNDCAYIITKSNNVTGSWNDSTHTYTVTGLSVDNGWVDIKATYLQALSITKRFTIAKLKAGKNGINGLDGLQGEKGEQGIPGKDGKDGTNGVNGKTSYFHIKYSSVANPTSSSQMTETPSAYIGTYVDFTESDSNDPKKYTWSKFEGKDGEDGIPGTNGADGKTYYLHIAYANSADGKTDFSTSNSTNKSYIGQYTDTTQPDSTDPAKYSWTKIKGDPGVAGRTYFLQSNAELLLMGADKKISPVTLTINAYYRDGQGEAKALLGYWKVEKSSDGGNTYSEISTAYTTTVKTINVAVNTMSLAAHDMIRVSVYSDAEKTILCDRQSFSVAIDVAALTQEDIVDILSNEGSWKGLYYLDGHLYISFDAAKGGTLILGGKNNGDGTQILYDANGKRVSKSDNDGTLYYKTYTDENNYTGFLFNKNGISFVEWVKGVETITPGIINFTADRTYINNNVYVYGWEGKARRKPVTSAGDAGSRIDYIGTGTGTTGGKEYRRMAVRGQWGSTTENYYATDYVYTNTGVSDIRLKDNVKDSEINALEVVNKMKVRQFDWKKGGHQNIGFVADELEEIDPNLALGGGYDENGEMDVKQINTSYLLNYAIKAIQELSATVKEQGCKIRELEERLDGIKGN